MANTKERILIVDDEATILFSLERVLSLSGYEVFSCETGEQALDMMVVHDVAVIICDQNLAGMQGDEVLRRASEIRFDVGRIMMTGDADMKTAIKSINYSHVDYFLRKPWDIKFLQKSVKDTVEKHRLIRENKRLEKLTELQHAELAEAHKQLQSELQLGAEIQKHLLTGTTPKNVSDFSTSVFTEPSRHIDGDFYDFFQLKEGYIDLLVGDVMGKGIPAALIGTAIKSLFSRYAQPDGNSRKKTNRQTNSLPAIDEILGNVHNEINSKLYRLDMFAALIYGRFDLQKHTFTFVDCGAAKPIHYRARQNTAELLIGENFPVGLVDHDRLYDFTVTYSPNDIFIFYSDGITEAMSPNGEMFGIDRLKDLIIQNHSLSTEELTDSIISSVKNFSNRTALDDDLTLIVVQDNEPNF